MTSSQHFSNSRTGSGSKDGPKPFNVVVAPDKFRGTLSAKDAGDAIADGVRRAGGIPNVVPMADGGEGTLGALGGANRTSTVPNALGQPSQAGWRLDGDSAIIELAAVAGLAMLGGPDNNDPVAASSDGVGALILEAVRLGARDVLVAVGGSASTDGGKGTVEMIASLPAAGRARLRVACDVEITFLEAAQQFGPQKGASPAEILMLSRRLEDLAAEYLSRFGIDVAHIRYGGAAGGFAGGLAAVGAELCSGFGLVASANELENKIAAADLVITGEGRLDEHSYQGKVVGGVIGMSKKSGVPSLILAGEILQSPSPADDCSSYSLIDKYGLSRSLDSPSQCLAELSESLVATLTRDLVKYSNSSNSQQDAHSRFREQDEEVHGRGSATRN